MDWESCSLGKGLHKLTGELLPVAGQPVCFYYLYMSTKSKYYVNITSVLCYPKEVQHSSPLLGISHCSELVIVGIQKRKLIETRYVNHEIGDG